MAARGCIAAASLQIMLSMPNNKPQVSLAMMVSETTPNVIHGSFVPQNPHSWLVQPFLPALQTLKSETLSLQLSGGVSVLTSSVGRHSNLTSDFLLVPQIRLQLTTVCNYAYIIYTALAYLLLTYRPQNFADNRLQHMLHMVKLPNKTDRLHTDWNTSRSLSTPSHHLHQTVGVPPSHRTWRVPGGLHLQTPPRDRAGTGRAVRAEWLDHTHTHTHTQRSIISTQARNVQTTHTWQYGAQVMSLAASTRWHEERNCANTIGTVPSAGHFQC